jgi:hypothetical protein
MSRDSRKYRAQYESVLAFAICGGMQGRIAPRIVAGLFFATTLLAWAPVGAEGGGERVVEPPAAATVAAGPVAQSKAQSEVIKQWSHGAGATRRRTEAKDLPEGVASALLSVLAERVRPCACGARRLRWAWALPIGADDQHPKLVVAFADPLRDPQQSREYVRLALLRHAEGTYEVTSSMAFRRPAVEGEFAYLDIRVHARHDADEDGREDLELLVVERRPVGERCAIARFTTASPEAKLMDQPCPAGVFESDAKNRSLL